MQPFYLIFARQPNGQLFSSKLTQPMDVSRAQSGLART
jgi:hypothetical protein